MSKSNGLVDRLSGAHDNTSDNETLPQNKNGNTQLKGLSRIAVGAIPTTPLPFNKKDGINASIRLAGYGALTILAFRMGSKKVGYTFAGVTAIALASSLGATAWD